VRRGSKNIGLGTRCNRRRGKMWFFRT